MCWRVATAVLFATITACSSEGDANTSGGAGATASGPDGSAAGSNGLNSGGASTSGAPSQGGNSTGAGGANSNGGSAAGSSGALSGGGASGTNVGGATTSGGRAGASGAASGTGGTGGGAVGGCTSVGSSCNPDTTICCPGAVCVTSTSPDYAGCREECATAADCTSGCCIPFANIPNKGFCGAAALCQCAGQDETCGGTRQCCSGFSCSTFDGTGALACHKACAQNSDCSTNCCVQVQGTADKVCLPAKPFCGP